MMHCIKTGITLYVQATNQYTRVDLFFDGEFIYVNKNKYFKGVPSEIEVDCLTLNIGDNYDRLNSPRFSPCVVNYIAAMKYKGPIEEKFLSQFK